MSEAGDPLGSAPIPGVDWFVTVLSQKLHQILQRETAHEGDRKQGRERTLLYGIINAVTDPILLTDTEGRLLIANARALSGFVRTAGQDVVVFSILANAFETPASLIEQTADAIVVRLATYKQ